MKKIILSLVVVLLYSSTQAQFRKLEKRNHNVNKLLNTIVNDNDFKNAGFAFLAVDLNTSETIAENNPDMALMPASTQKLFSTATVLELYGPDYQFETNIYYSGTIDSINHILHGNIIIKGGGDPTLGSKYFNGTANNQFLLKWTKAINNLKIDSVAGGVIADAGIYSRDIVPTTWSWQDMGNYYGAGANGLSIYDNYYTIYFNSSKFVGDTTTIDTIIPEIPGLQFENGVIGDSITYDNAYIFGAPYSYQRVLRGEIPLNKTDFKVKGSIPDPAYIAAYELENFLKNNGIKLKNEATTIRKLKLEKKQIDESKNFVIATKSPELSEIITQTNIHSINLFAEHCLNHSAIKLGAKSGTYYAAKAIMKFWKSKGMDIQGLSLNDGSGLSHYNVITPRQMIYLLNYMKNKSQYFDTFYNSMALAGKTGTIKNMFIGTSAEGNLRAKSGTINRVKAYAGYVTSKSGREIAFSMAANNFSCTSQQARAKLEKLMIALAEFDK